MTIAEIIMSGLCYVTIGGMTLAGIWGVYDTFFRWQGLAPPIAPSAPPVSPSTGSALGSLPGAFSCPHTPRMSL